jgi:hypothetical protein
MGHGEMRGIKEMELQNNQCPLTEEIYRQNDDHWYH